MDPRWVLSVGGGIFAGAFVGAFLLHAAIHATNAVLPSRRGLAVPLPSVDRAITLLLIASALNLGVNWAVMKCVAAELGAGIRADEVLTQFLGGLAALPFNAAVTALVVRAGLPTTFSRAGVVVLFQCAFAVVFALAAGLIALFVVPVARACAADLQTSVIGGVVAGAIGAVVGFAACLERVEERHTRARRPPARSPVARPGAGFGPGSDARRGRRLVVGLALLAVVLVVLFVLMPLHAP